MGLFRIRLDADPVGGKIADGSFHGAFHPESEVTAACRNEGRRGSQVDPRWLQRSVDVDLVEEVAEIGEIVEPEGDPVGIELGPAVVVEESVEAQAVGPERDVRTHLIDF